MSLFVFLLVVGSAFFHASWNAVLRRSSGDFAMLWLSLLVGSLLFTPVAVWALAQEGSSLTGWLMMAGTGLIHAFYFGFLSMAYRHGEMSVVYPVARGSGVSLTALVAVLFLGEVVSPLGGAGIGLVVVGILVMGLSRQGGNVLGSLMWALAVGITIVAYSVLDKIAVASVSPLVYIWAMFFGAWLFLLPVAIHGGVAPLRRALREHRVPVAVVGIASMLTYMTILYAFRLAPVGYVVAVREVAVAIGAVFGFVFLREQATPRKIAAIVLILLGLVLIRLA